MKEIKKKIDKGCDKNGEQTDTVPNEFPPWFYEKCLTEKFSDSTAPSHYLSACMRDANSALSLYHTHVRYSTTLLLSLLTAMIAIFSILTRFDMNTDIIRNIERAGAVLMFVAGLIGSILVYIITRYHNYWIATLLYATQVHYSVGMICFRWYEREIKFLKQAYAKNKNITKKDYIQGRPWYVLGGSHVWYALIIGVLSLLCYIAAIILGRAGW